MEVTAEKQERDLGAPDLGTGRGSRRTPSEAAVNRIAVSRAITFSGGNAAFIALLFVLYRETDSAGVVAVGALASFAVPAVASPVAGWLGDRFDRRTVMVTSELLGAACFILSAAVASEPTELLVIRVLASLATAPLIPAGAASLPGIVRSQDELPAANAKLAAVGLIGGVVGPLLAAALIAVSGPGSVFLFNAATFLVSAALLASIDADFRPTSFDREKGGVSDLATGFHYLGSHGLLRPVTLAYATIFIGLGVTAPAEVVLSTDFGAGATGFAALTCAFASGGIAGAGFAGRALFQFSIEPTTMLVGASGALTIGLLMVGFAPHFLVVLAGMAIAGAADGIWIVAHENLVQRVTPDEIRSRVFAAGEAVYQGGIAVGAIGAGGLIAAFGAAGAFRFGAFGSIVACVLLVVTGAAAAKISPKAPGVRRGGTLAAPPKAPAGVAPARIADRLSQTADQRTG